MPQEMVISFFKDGAAQHTLKDDFIKLDGEREVARVSDILHSSQWQRFYVLWLRGKYAGTELGTNQWFAEVGKQKPPGNVLIMTGIFMFDKYEQAVAAEVAMLNAMRLKGETF